MTSPARKTRARPSCSFVTRTLQDFSSRTTIHGAAYVGDSSLPAGSRLLWLVVTLLSSGLAATLTAR